MKEIAQETRASASSLEKRIEVFEEVAPSVDEGPPPPELTIEQEKRLYRKIDIRLMPMLTAMYLVSFLDRGNIGNAKLQGILSSLHMTSNQFNIALTMYFIPYCLFECPANLVLKRLRPSRWLPGITVAWGIIMVSMGFVKNYPQLVGTRLLLGVAEAGLFPGVIYYLSIWYPRYKLQYRIAVFWGAAASSGAFSGLLAFGISFLSGTDGFLGWSWIFILEGLLTIVVGFIAFFVLFDFPDTATFLTPEERAYVIHKKSACQWSMFSAPIDLATEYDNSSVGEEEHFEPRHLIAAFTDWQVWLHVLVHTSIITPVFGITLFLPSIINGFGFDTATTQLLTVPPYVFATILIIIFANISDRIKMRFPFVTIGHIMCLIGFSINISPVSIGAKYLGTFFIVGGCYSAFPAVVAWLANNLSGQYKRGVGTAMQIGIGNFGGAVASNIFRAQDAPRYVLGYGIMLMYIGIGMIAVPIVVLNYRRINARRDKAEADGRVDYDPAELRRLGDRAPDFRYTL
ncbi:MFS general substrate transporter [Punctularia strigosozonata HHB-11173 SS5]|uniref:MFS general substrate transporter n=1 Tax=Punctularia strigosozonata (strain HHB-11173) TaxID=741275 RepID=UPI000441674C|nr:MFS general substrate transporter [Punctularia strigosozonata HHB-11173 SS5]EIN14726.1 MFS general substrate transporter [Punctularia strigosozonata HHB-11173 SS5]